MTTPFSVTAAILALLLATMATRGQSMTNTTWFCDYPAEDVPTQRELLDQLIEQYAMNSSSRFYPKIGFFREKYMQSSTCVNHDHLTKSIYEIVTGKLPLGPDPKLWPSRDIPFLIDDSYPAEAAQRILDDMSVFSNHTCIRFLNRTDERVFIRFVHPNNAGSLAAYTEDGEFAPSSGPDGVPEEIEGIEPGYRGAVRNIIRSEADMTSGSGVMQTLMYTLGFKREELKQDRDDYLYLRYSPGDTETSKMFQREIATESDLTFPYDSLSVTHMTVKEAEDLNVRLESMDSNYMPLKPVGNSVLSEGDINKINSFYCQDFYKTSTQSTQQTSPQDLVTLAKVTLAPETSSTVTTETTVVTMPSEASVGVSGGMEETGGSGDEVSKLEEGSSGEGSGDLHTEAPEMEGSGDREEVPELGLGRGDEYGATTLGSVSGDVSSTETTDTTGTTSTSTAAPTHVSTTTRSTTTEGIFIDTSSSARPRVSSALALVALLGLMWRTTARAGGN